jgi:hypothetical protein
MGKMSNAEHTAYVSHMSILLLPLSLSLALCVCNQYRYHDAA